MGRTTSQWIRIYINGYRISGYTESIGPFGEMNPELARAALTDQVETCLPGRAQIGPGVLNGIFDNTALGLHALASGGGAARNLLIAVGENAEPVAGNVSFAGVFRQLDYKATGEGVLAAIARFAGWESSAAVKADKAFGALLHPDQAETAANSAVGVDDFGAATAFGGYMAYQVLAGDGTATLKVQDAAINTNPSFADLTGATTGSINCASPTAGLIATSLSQAVRQFLRPQIVLGTATTVTFLLAFARRFRA